MEKTLLLAVSYHLFQLLINKPASMVIVSYVAGQQPPAPAQQPARPPPVHTGPTPNLPGTNTPWNPGYKPPAGSGTQQQLDPRVIPFSETYFATEQTHEIDSSGHIANPTLGNTAELFHLNDLHPDVRSFLNNLPQKWLNEATPEQLSGLIENLKSYEDRAAASLTVNNPEQVFPAFPAIVSGGITIPADMAGREIIQYGHVQIPISQVANQPQPAYQEQPPHDQQNTSWNNQIIGQLGLGNVLQAGKDVLGMYYAAKGVYMGVKGAYNTAQEIYQTGQRGLDFLEQRLGGQFGNEGARVEEEPLLGEQEIEQGWQPGEAVQEIWQPGEALLPEEAALGIGEDVGIAAAEEVGVSVAAEGGGLELLALLPLLFA